MLSTDYICKQLGPRSEMSVLIVLVKEFLKKKYFETNQQMTTKACKIINQHAKSQKVSCNKISYIVWSIELELHHIILQHICSWSVTTCLMLVVALILTVKSNIIIIVMSTEKKISFLVKIYKNSKNCRILGLPFGLTETHIFECIA